MKQIKKYIFLGILFPSILYLSLGDGYTALHTLAELPSTLMEAGINKAAEEGMVDIIHEKERYEKERYEKELESDIVLFPVLDDHAVIGSSYIVERRSRLANAVSDTIVTSELLEQTMIRNSHNNSINPSDFAIRETTSIRHAQAKRKYFKEKGLSIARNSEATLLSFEFGIADTHLIFSEPVLLSVDTPDIPDGSFVDLLVHHAGDDDFNTLGLMTDSNGKCNGDGSATNPSSRTIVHDGKVSFYTCGASTFALGYVPTVDIPNNTVWSLATQSDGKIILGGQFTTVGGVARGRVARVSSGGALDTTFTNPNANNIVYATAVQSDGKIVVGGAFTGVSGSGRNFLARINTDGTLDATFNPNVNNQVRTIAIQSDGKIVVGGTFTGVTGVLRNRVARLNSDGTLDGTYTPNFNNNVFSITLQSDGRALVGGQFTTMSGTARNRIARLSTTGGLDGSFTPNFNNIVQDIKLYSDNSIAVGGQFTTLSGAARNRFAKLSSTGGLISFYNPNANGTINTIYIDGSDNLYLGGAFTTMSGAARNRIAKLSSTGGLIGTFNPNSNNTVYALVGRQDGTMAIGGAFTTIYGMTTNTYLTYSYPTGVLDSRYNLGINGTVWSLATQSDGKIILGGQFTTVGGVARGRVARVSTGGALDTTFTNSNANNIVYATAIQSDGKTLIGGAFTGVSGSGMNYLARLNTDGTLDTSFNPNITLVAGNQVRTIAIQSDGQILIGGVFTTVNGVARNRIARLSTTGSLDTTYNPNSNNAIYSIALQGDGRALVGGAFTTIVGTARNRIARLSTTGALDTTFNPNSNNTIWDIKLFSDNSIAVGGRFTTIAGAARNRIAKLSSTGGNIGTFNPNANGTLNVIYIDGSDNLYLGGAFTTIAGAARNRIAKLSSTGGLIGTFNPNSNNTVYSLMRDIDNNIIAGGAFTTMSGMIVRYFSWIGLYDGDITPPQILTGSMISGSLLPKGNFSVTTGYSDTGASINTGSLVISLQPWSGGTWGSDVAPSYLSGTPTRTTSTGIYTFSGVPYGKYRYRLSVADIWGNTSTYETTFYIDAIEWEIDQDIIDIGDIVPGTQKNSFPGDELTITVRTVGAAFNLVMSGTSFASGTTTIPHWDSSSGYGYERYNAGYTGTLSSFSGGITLVSQGASINTNGSKNIYTYRIQYGVLVDMMQQSGDYSGRANFTLNLSY